MGQLWLEKKRLTALREKTADELKREKLQKRISILQKKAIKQLD